MASPNGPMTHAGFPKAEPAHDAELLGKPLSGWRLTLYTIIFEADTKAGKAFDIALIVAILLSILVVVLDSVAWIAREWSLPLTIVEWVFTLFFTAEYVARLLCVRRPLKYALSFYGLIDLIAVLPTYLAFLWPDLHLLIDVRVLRLLRIFRVFKLTMYAAEYRFLAQAIHASRQKIVVFLSFVLMLVLVLATLMYVVEGPEHGFTSIPTAIYWGVTTITTVGYGDISPKTDLGRFIASCMMMLGWGVLAVPTGIVTAEMGSLLNQPAKRPTTRTCHECLTEDHAPEANYCQHCGAKLPAYAHD